MGGDTIDGGVTMQKGANQTFKSSLLRISTRIGRIVTLVASDIGDAYGFGIVRFAMRTGLTDWTTRLYSTIEADHEMITYPCEASLVMPSVDVSSMIILTLLSSGAMDDDFIYSSHFAYVLRIFQARHQFQE